MAEPVIYLIDDDAAFRDSLCFLLETESKRVQAFESPTAFLAAADTISHGLIITDVRMPDMNGLQLVRALRDRGVRHPIIMITGHGDVPLAVEAMKAGVADFIEKPFSDEAILSAVNAALAREAASKPDDEVRAPVLRRFETLTEREQQVMRRVVAGESNKVIAQNLGISPRTVDIYRANVMSKMRAGGLSELVRMAIAGGID